MINIPISLFKEKYLNTAYLLRCMKTFPLFLILSMTSNSVISNINNGQPFDVDALRCNDIACAYVYQGEGINHPQLIVQIWRNSGSSSYNNSYDYIYDFPNSATPSISLYIDGSLAHRTGPSSVQLSDTDILTMAADGLMLAEGVQLAFTGPETYHLNMWPNLGTINNIIEESVAEVPQSIIEWDQNNLDIPTNENPSQPTPIPTSGIDELTICKIKHDIYGTIIEDCIDEPTPSKTSFEPGSNDLAVCEIGLDQHGTQYATCDQDPKVTGGKGIVKVLPVICYQETNAKDRSQTLICDKNYKKPIPKKIRETFTALTDCRSAKHQTNCPQTKDLEKIEDGRRQLENRLKKIGTYEKHIFSGSQSLVSSPLSTSEPLACSPEDLINYPDIGLCKGRCQQCELMWNTWHTVEAAHYCTTLNLVGATTFLSFASKAAFESVKRVGLASGVSAVAAATATCTAFFVASKAAFRASRLQGCDWWCENCLEGGSSQCSY